MPNTRIPGKIILSGSIPTTALSGGVVSSSAQINTGSFSGSISNAESASFSTTASFAASAAGTLSNAEILFYSNF